MIINNTIQGVSSLYAASGSVKRAMKAAEKTAVARDEIQLSSQAQSFSSVLNKLKAGQDVVRKDKVAYYENLIASGSYNVDSMELAAKMLQTRF